jgi:hypothetical protein
MVVGQLLAGCAGGGRGCRREHGPLRGGRTTRWQATALRYERQARQRQGNPSTGSGPAARLGGDERRVPAGWKTACRYGSPGHTPGASTRPPTTLPRSIGSVDGRCRRYEGGATGRQRRHGDT